MSSKPVRQRRTTGWQRKCDSARWVRRRKDGTPMYTDAAYVERETAALVVRSTVLIREIAGAYIEEVRWADL